MFLLLKDVYFRSEFDNKRLVMVVKNWSRFHRQKVEVLASTGRIVCIHTIVEDECSMTYAQIASRWVVGEHKYIVYYI